MELKYVFYFLVGGTLTSLIPYLASHSRGILAAFLASLPVLSLSTFLIIYFNTGPDAVLSYAKGLVLMLLPWMLYILSILFLTPRLNFPFSLLIGMGLFIAVSWVFLSRYNPLGS